MFPSANINFLRYNNCVNFIHNCTIFLHTVCELSREKNIIQKSLTCMHCLPISGHVIIHQTTVSFKFEIIVAVLFSAPSVVLQLLTWKHNIYKWICCQGFLPKAPSQKIFRSADILLVTA